MLVPATLFLLLGFATQQPSAIDCAKATTRVDKLICADASLVASDERLTRFYAAALDAMDSPACIRNDQRDWLVNTRNRCTTPACLRAAYQRRLGTLLLLQPGINVPNNLELPAVPRLRWMIPTVGPPDAPVLRSTPFTARGTIGYDLNKGGYVLDSGDGLLHTLIPEMLIEPKTYVQLGVLKDMKTAVTVTGRHAVAPGNRPMFDNRYCVAIYSN
jgi:uncharacterized protein YecT (DUF1311 family)